MDDGTIRHSIFRGSIASLVTPFREGGIDEDAFARLVDRQVRAGTGGLVVAGPDGEGPTLTETEASALLAVAKRIAAGRVPVFAFVGCNGTAAAIRTARRARDGGADGLVVVTPFYNKPSQEGVIRHMHDVAASVDLPLMAMNDPDRCSLDLHPVTIGQISRIPGVEALCEASRRLTRPTELVAHVRPGFAFICGHDAAAVAFNLNGGSGALSVLANLLPQDCAALQKACLRHHWREAESIELRLESLVDALALETSPVLAKSALAGLLLGVEESFRLPLVPPGRQARSAVRSLLGRLIAETERPMPTPRGAEARAA